MNKEQLAPWIEKLTQVEKKDWKSIVAEMCREHGLKTGDAWNLLKEAGFDPKPASDDTPKVEEKKVSVMARHKTEYPRYRCAGLSLSQKTETYKITEAQLDALKKDPWVEIIEK
jgi:hypothetical protein